MNDTAKFQGLSGPGIMDGEIPVDFRFPGSV